MEIDFIGGQYETFSKNINSQECIGFFPVIDKTGGKPLSLRGTPGLLEWVDLSDESELRNVIELSRWAYWVCGDTVYQVDTSGTAVACAGTLNTDEGYVWMATNNADQIMIVDGNSGYTITGTTLTQITDTDFPSHPTSVAFQDGYFIVTFEESGRIYISGLNAGTTWDGSDYGNAEARPDDSLALISDRDELIVIGEKSKQSFQNTGATFPFKKVSGSTQSIGINAPASLIQFTNTFFWLSDNLQFVQADGYGAKPISPPSIDYQIAQMSTPDDCVSFGYIQEGNAFLVNQFKTANQTWVYDVSTGFWHRRRSYPNYGRWRANCYVYFAGKHLVGDHSNGIIYELDFDTFSDDGEEILRKRIPPAIASEGKEIRHHSLEIFFEPGVGLAPTYDRSLAYDNQTGVFTVGNTVTGATSAATGVVVRNTIHTSTTGILYLKTISGTFSDNEIIYESAVSAEYITDSDNQDFTDGTINEWVVVATGGTGVCEYEGTDPGAEKVMEIRATNADNTALYGTLPTTQMTAFANGNFIVVSANIYLPSGNTNNNIAMAFASMDTSAGYSDTGLDKDEWHSISHYFRFTGTDVTGLLTFSFGSAPANGDILYVDEISVKKVTNAALANGTLVDYDSDVDPGTDPMAMLRYSNDGGHTWSSEIWRSVGKIGETEWRATWHRLGSSKNRVYELTVSDPVKWVITGANLEAS